MHEDGSYSPAVVWRLHKRLWELNKLSLQHEMKVAKEKMEVEGKSTRVDDRVIEAVGLVGVAHGVE